VVDYADENRFLFYKPNQLNPTQSTNYQLIITTILQMYPASNQSKSISSYNLPTEGAFSSPKTTLYAPLFKTVLL